ncbi:CPBP family intramembrane glutamic endopeptidase [Ovoidimarina sediminis]|uniref:CPBP family intramembrane glutamic endopeptidase n=1 Tax=Ovoidimarina sediminis TaxID=3079856 RepID=UPI002908A9FF|nr:type II CAAX endopeptidase family protein [Rhodophyticola sp. MJ-SS7]MDU8944460.1 type II CAAX endopeptidase family protein [Rhodophyticola sp. MJ-SS7]
MTLRTPAFEAFVAPARPTRQIWMLLLGLLLAVVIYAFVTLVIFAVVWVVRGLPQNVIWFEELIRADTPDKLLILLVSFVGMALGPMAAVLMLHERPVGTLFGRAPVVLRDFTVAAAVAGTVLGASLIFWSWGNDAVPGLPCDRWIVLLPLAAVLVLIQTGAEELVFRGYMQQQLGARFRSPIAWALVPAMLFGVAHFDVASAGPVAPLVVISAGLFGLMAADLTAQTGSIGAAWGFHFANNMLALTLIATEGTLTGLALYKTPYAVSDLEVMRTALPFDLLMMGLIWFAIRRILSR